MHQNLSSKKRYHEWHEGDPTRFDVAIDKQRLNHCLTLHLADGSVMIFYYLYLLKAEFKLLGECNAIILRFSTDKVTLRGYQLEPLFGEFAKTKPSDIFVCHPRYMTIAEVNEPVVIEAIIEERK